MRNGGGARRKHTNYFQSGAPPETTTDAGAVNWTSVQKNEQGDTMAWNEKSDQMS